MAQRVHAQQQRYRAFGKWQRLLDRRWGKPSREPGGKTRRRRQTARG